MDYALILLLPILGGLMLGHWLSQKFGISPVWSVVLGILGMFAGIGIMYKRYAFPELYGEEKRPLFKKRKPAPPPGPPVNDPDKRIYYDLSDINLDENDEAGPDLSEFDRDDEDPRLK